MWIIFLVEYIIYYDLKQLCSLFIVLFLLAGLAHEGQGELKYIHSSETILKNQIVVEIIIFSWNQQTQLVKKHK